MSSGQREACEWAPGEAPIPHKQVQGLVALWEKDKKEPGKELEPASWEGGLQPQLPSEPPLPHPPSVPREGAVLEIVSTVSQGPVSWAGVWPEGMEMAPTVGRGRGKERSPGPRRSSVPPPLPLHSVEAKVRWAAVL